MTAKDLCFGFFWSAIIVAFQAAVLMKNSLPFVVFLLLLAAGCAIYGTFFAGPKAVSKPKPAPKNINAYTSVPHVIAEDARFWAQKAQETPESNAKTVAQPQPKQEKEKVDMLKPVQEWAEKNWQLLAGAMFATLGVLIMLSSVNLYNTEAFRRFCGGFLLFLLGSGLALAQYGKLGGFASWLGKTPPFIILALLVAAYAYFAHSESGLPASQDPWIGIMVGAIVIALLLGLHAIGKLDTFLENVGSVIHWALTTWPFAGFAWGVLLGAGSLLYGVNGGDFFLVALIGACGITFTTASFLWILFKEKKQNI